jgi:hypothetical protein
VHRIIYSVGDGTHGQLGYECEFDQQKHVHDKRKPHQPGPAGDGASEADQNKHKQQAHKESKILQQSYPRAVNPTGSYKPGNAKIFILVPPCSNLVPAGTKSDLKFAQVAAGGMVSFGREMCLDEGLMIRRGLTELQQRLAAMKKLYPESNSINSAWSVVRQEAFDVHKIAEVHSVIIILWFLYYCDSFSCVGRSLGVGYGAKGSTRIGQVHSFSSLSNSHSRSERNQHTAHFRRPQSCVRYTHLSFFMDAANLQFLRMFHSNIQ